MDNRSLKEPSTPKPTHSEDTQLSDKATTIKDYSDWHKNLIRASVQTSMTIGAIVLCCYPIEWFQTRRQVNMPLNRKDLISPGFWLANAGFIKAGLISSSKNCAVKNTVITNRESVHSHVNDALSDHESLHNRQDHKHKALSVGVTAGFIASVETTFTQKNANLKVLSDIGKLPPLHYRHTGPLVHPTKKHWSERWWGHFRFAKVGAGMRFTANFTNAICFMTLASPEASGGPFKTYFPKEKYGPTEKILNTIAVGALCGSVLNTMSVVYKRQIRNMDVETFKAPNIAQTIYRTLKQDGPKAFFRGSLMGMTCTTVAYLAISGVDALCVYLFEGKPRDASPAPLEKAPATDRLVTDAPQALNAEKSSSSVVSTQHIHRPHPHPHKPGQFSLGLFPRPAHPHQFIKLEPITPGKKASHRP